MTESSHSSSISALPEGCISEILSLTSPRDACRAATISKTFNSAADSDAVWERFLPPDYRDVIATAVPPVIFESKKQLYHRLSDSYILLDRGNLGFKLDKESGRKCYLVGARDLSIIWSNDTRYWVWGNVPESRFEEVATLREVWWLDIYGKLSSVMLSPNTTYATHLVFRIDRDSSELSVPAKTILDFGGIRTETINVFLQQPGILTGRGAPVRAPAPAPAPAARNDGWMDIKLGEFYYNDGDEGEVGMGFQEHDNYARKQGLIVEGIEIRPK
ncbi:hypothetical protein R6Q59_013552 [Mikania micrantha]|uniref:F-box domain-containing protein n=1 Tax=Mikania micrantha TaxID=192012 RepID=A0A5N6P407_9ASTR|nr:hypothetical protein E3N88_11913 [Mikania micrantha]